MVPDPSPPFHQISLPPPCEPVRKLQTVRFSTEPPSAFQTSTPLRPAGLPLAVVGAELLVRYLALHCGALRLGAVDDHGVAVHAAQVHAGGRDPDTGRRALSPTGVVKS